jgi:hypothetical protein
MMPQLDFHILNSQLLIMLFLVIGYVIFIKYTLPILVMVLKFETKIYVSACRKILKANKYRLFTKIFLNTAITMKDFSI